MQSEPESLARAFISYSHEDRQVAAEVKRVLAEVGVDAFRAHEDLGVSDDWRGRILAERRGCAMFVPLLSMNFMGSRWAPQEVGFIISRPDVLIVPLSID